METEKSFNTYSFPSNIFKNNFFLRHFGGVTLFYIFANTFSVWLNWRQLDSLVCFFILSTDMCCLRYKKTQVSKILQKGTVDSGPHFEKLL